MLSRDCDGCPLMRECKQRFIEFRKGEFVACPDGSKHLIDINPEWMVVKY
jgi:hypothetical protein